MERTHYCGTLRRVHIGRQATVCGWVLTCRDMGGVIFVDVRDREGVVQTVFDQAVADPASFALAERLKNQSVVKITGEVRLRDESTYNPALPTGEVELAASHMELLSAADTLPFSLSDEEPVREEVRLKYRYLDLRRPQMYRNLLFRHTLISEVQRLLNDQGFLQVETPILCKSTPEGARDYLVPSRVHPGTFYALPQSPQIYKQLLMVSGIDKYYQVARCFRDEDLRADRQPEFTQIDLEMSFVDQDDVMAIGEGFMKRVYKEVLGIDIETPFRRMTWHEAMDRFGSDKPDLRFGMELINLSDLLRNTEFKVFAGALAGGGSVRGINLKGKAEALSRKEIDKLTEWIKAYGAKGLAWTRLAEKETSSYEKFLSPEEVAAIRSAMGAEPGDVLLLVASDENKVVWDSLGALRCNLAARFGLIDKSKPCLLWITDFPMFEYSKEEQRWVAMHHPFTMPRPEDIDKLATDPGAVCAVAYDMVLDGNEVGGGSLRINDSELQAKMFEALGFTPEEAQHRFGFLIDAFKYGAPPHGGMAFGLDRLVMLMLGCDSIREVIAFPKVASSSDLMTEAPTDVDAKQLEELGIAVVATQPQK